MKKYGLFVFVCLLSLCMISCKSKEIVEDTGIYSLIDKTVDDKNEADSSVDDVKTDIVMNDIQKKMASLVLNKAEDEIFANDIKKVETITIIGKFVTRDKEVNLAFSPSGYIYKGQEYSYSDNVSDLLQGISIFSELKTLNIYYNAELDNLDFLSNCKQLKELRIDMGSFESLEVLADLDKLETLTLNSCPIRDIAAIENLDNLKNISISDADITNLKPISKLKNLISLNIHYNRSVLENIDVLSELDKLEEVGIGYKNMDASFLNNLNNSVRTLSLGGGTIDCNDLVRFSNLELLTMENCVIVNAAKFRNIQNKPNVSFINVKGITDENINTIRKSDINVISIESKSPSYLYFWLLEDSEL